MHIQPAQLRGRSKALVALTAAGLVLTGSLYACNGWRFGQPRLVEVFDNGPAGGPRGASEGYIWVGKDDAPPPGKTWAPVDPETLTPEQKKRIR